ncbi:LysR family transcriptional regulator [Bradyrhizobium elkanii]|uniref:LysR family transcriptional regulator n=1 Tax=Bradyrhizobium elkanii TaxID=29448 RepID=UPI001BA463B8|nr:LysR family transcriptional regulator [Bradyrhizobium elkanii]MBR1162255.1 LysR family transcriptional regulator [Bradyrhizobium elkanii]
MALQNGQNFRNYETLAGVAAFVHAAEQGGFAAAGRILGLSGSAVGKAVGRLEARLGVRLLNRTTRKVTLTGPGAEFFRRARNILAELDEAEQVLAEQGGVPRGRLKVSLPHNIGQLLVPRLAEFARRFPDVALDVQLEDRLVDMVGEAIDVALRTGELTDSSLIASRIGPQHFVICGTPDYFRRMPQPETPNDLAVHRGVSFRVPTTGQIYPWSFCGEFAGAMATDSVTFNNSDGVLAAIRSGIGIGQLPVILARSCIARGDLVAVLTDYMVPRGSVWIAWPSNRYRSLAQRAFVDFIRQQLPDTVFEPIGKP